MSRERRIVFRLGGRLCALSLDHIAGVDDPGEMRIVPGAPPAVVGLTEWRGRVVTVLDLGVLAGTEPQHGLRCVVALCPPLEGTALLVPTPIELRSGESSPEGGRESYQKYAQGFNEVMKDGTYKGIFY